MSDRDRPDTSGAAVRANYQVATPIRVGTISPEPAVIVRSRMVPTSAKSGYLDLRYAPRKPRIIVLSTAF